MTIEQEAQKWEEQVRQASLASRPETKEVFETQSGYPVKPLYTPLDVNNMDYLKDIGFPGQSPFTRGRTPNGFRSFHWPHDFYSGYGSSLCALAWWRLDLWPSSGDVRATSGLKSSVTCMACSLAALEA